MLDTRHSTNCEGRLIGSGQGPFNIDSLVLNHTQGSECHSQDVPHHGQLSSGTEPQPFAARPSANLGNDHTVEVTLVKVVMAQRRRRAIFRGE